MSLLATLIRRYDRWRFPTGPTADAAWQKEWYHFCVSTPECDAILNLNVCADMRPAAARGSREARTILLVRRGEGWDGDVETVAARDVSGSPGGMDLAFGSSRVAFREGCFQVSACLESRPLALHLEMRPVTFPLALRRDVAVGRARINWFALPRLLATGTVVCGRRVYPCRTALAYHDHNWGRWLWGQDFSWEWGFAHLATPAGPAWALVYDLTSNRARSRAFELTLALWREERLHRLFSRDELEVEREGLLAPSSLLKVPRVMALVAPETTTEVPRTLRVRAAAGTDRVEVVFEAEEVMQILIPNETDLETTVINEVSGRLVLTGEVKGEAVRAQGRGIFEFLTG